MHDNSERILQAIQSEHCSYKSTKRFLSTLYVEGSHVIQGPGENAGIVDIGNGYALALRIESHNHPSFIDPYEGAATGVGGILRDIFTMGSRPIALLDFLRFSNDEKGNALLPEVVRGISDYGNTVGIPTVGGNVYFHPSYRENCLVNICAIGLVEKTNIVYGNALRPGSDIIYVGARTGRDGIGGSEMASATLIDVNPASIQSSDPFLEKLLLEACIELARDNEVEGMQDMGAAGILCSTSEVIYRGRKKTNINLGCSLELDNVPLKAADMTLTDILLSESQERMLLVVDPTNTECVTGVLHKYDLESVAIGKVTNNGLYCASYKNQSFCIPINDLFPDLHQDWGDVPVTGRVEVSRKASSALIQSIWEQYDWMIGSRTLKGPSSPGSYAILDIPEVGGELVITWGSLEKARKRLLFRGADPLAITNCLNFSHPSISMGDFSLTIEALRNFSKRYQIPVVSGNVSLYNSGIDTHIIPTPIYVMVGMRYK